MNVNRFGDSYMDPKDIFTYTSASRFISISSLLALYTNLCLTQTKKHLVQLNGMTRLLLKKKNHNVFILYSLRPDAHNKRLQSCHTASTGVFLAKERSIDACRERSVVCAVCISEPTERSVVCAVCISEPTAESVVCAVCVSEPTAERSVVCAVCISEPTADRFSCVEECSVCGVYI